MITLHVLATDPARHNWSAVDASGLIGAMEQGRNSALILGIIGLIVGVYLLFAHKKWLEQSLRNEEDTRVRRFEIRKFRRRSAVAAMIASTGCMLAALYWVEDPTIAAIFLLLISGGLVGILGSAIFDLISVSLHTLTKPADDSTRQALIEEYLRRKKQSASKASDEA